MSDIVISRGGGKVCTRCRFVNEENDWDGDLLKCRGCGFVISEKILESGIQFDDTKVVGQTHDMFKSGRDTTKYAEECIETMIRDLRISSDYPDYLERIGETPIRIMKFAYKAYFLDHGSNIHHYSASALYIALRFQKAPFLLMDFSEKLCINLFKLARCYRKLAKFLNVTLKLNERLPSIDPSIYIPRFCKMLQFDEKVDLVKATAIKLLKRMKLDWMSHGRRPSSLCGAAILIAARMHGFKRTTGEVCKVVFVCEETLRKRLEEFKETEVAKLTREKFDEIEDIGMLGRERDPPAFIKALHNSQQLQLQQSQQQQTLSNSNHHFMIASDPAPSKKLKPNEDNDDEIINKELEDAAAIIETQVLSTANDPTASRELLKKPGFYLDDDDEEEDGEEDSKDPSTQSRLVKDPAKSSQQFAKEPVKLSGDMQLAKMSADTLATTEKSSEGLNLNVCEVLSEMSDEEQNFLILSNQEHTVKSILWHSMNEQWLREQQRKDPKDEKKESKKRNKRRNDQLMNEDDPVDAIFKCKKIKDNLDKNKVIEIYRQISNIKRMELKDIFLQDAPPAESLEITQQIVHHDALFDSLPGLNIQAGRFANMPLSSSQVPVSAPQLDEDGYEYE